MSADWPGPVATGIGSMPGVDPLAAARLAFGEVALPFVPELPGRGAGADMVGRAAGLLIDIPMDTHLGGYRLGSGRTRLMSRADGFLCADFDAVEEVIERSGSIGTRPARFAPGAKAAPVKLASIGPFTFAACVELPSGHKVLHDRGAWRDVVGSLGEGLARRADDLANRTGADVVVELDEPMIGSVIDGQIQPLTRLDVNRAIPVSEVAEALLAISSRVGRPLVLHSCGAPRWDLITRLSGYAVSMDVAGVGPGDYDALGGFLDGGGRLIAGVVPTMMPATALSADELAARLVAVVDRIGLSRKVFREQVIVSPTCGLAGAGDWAGRALALATRVADQLRHVD